MDFLRILQDELKNRRLVLDGPVWAWFELDKACDGRSVVVVQGSRWKCSLFVVVRQTAEAYVFFERCASRNAYGRDVPQVGSRKVADLLKRFRARRLRQRPSASCPLYCWTEEEEEVMMGCASKDGNQLPGLSH